MLTGRSGDCRLTIRWSLRITRRKDRTWRGAWGSASRAKRRHAAASRRRASNLLQTACSGDGVEVFAKRLPAGGGSADCAAVVACGVISRGGKELVPDIFFRHLWLEDLAKLAAMELRRLSAHNVAMGSAEKFTVRIEPDPLGAGRFRWTLCEGDQFICGHRIPTQLESRLSEKQIRPCRSSPKHGTGTNDRKMRTALKRSSDRRG